VGTKEYAYTGLFEPAEEGGYAVTCPTLPSLVTEGDTLEEARAMAKDAIRAYLESLQKERASIPQDKPLQEEPVKEKVKVVLETVGVRDCRRSDHDTSSVPSNGPGFFIHHTTGGHHVLKHRISQHSESLSPTMIKTSNDGPWSQTSSRQE
jgi:predicted RNase H-like HicB family nuclease